MAHYRLSDAKAHLCGVDNIMEILIQEVGSTGIRSEAKYSVFQSLVRAIAYQMISTKAAAAIYTRLGEHCGGDITPDNLLALGDQALRDIGFSRAKVASLLDLSGKVTSGVIPKDRTLAAMPDKELIKCLTQVKGIGTWSVEILMIFNLRRADVFPATDLGVRRGHMLAYQLDDMLTAKELMAASEPWQPYRSVAAWYLWRANDKVDWDAVRRAHPLLSRL